MKNISKNVKIIIIQPFKNSFRMVKYAEADIVIIGKGSD